MVITGKILQKGDILKKCIYVVIGCDTDPDRDYFVKNIPAYELSWRGMLEGLLRAKEKLHKIVDSAGSPPLFTLLLRADDQIKNIYGDYNSILARYAKYLLELENEGYELGWHPHFWYRAKTNENWYQNYRDIEWQADMLERAYDSYQKVLPGRGRSVRMGWCYHNNRTMATLEKLGLEIDLRALPGLRIDPFGKINEGANFFDWGITPYGPFKPSKIDYRRPAGFGEQSYSILEAPNFVARSMIWGLFSGFVLFKKMRDIRQIRNAIKWRSYFSTITAKPALFGPILRQLAKNVRIFGKVFYITPLHADELIENIHPIYSLENMFYNLESISKLSSRLDAEIRFVKASDIIKLL